MSFDNSICQFQMLVSCSEGLTTYCSRKTLVDVSGPQKGEEDMDTAAFDYSTDIDGVLRYSFISCLTIFIRSG